MKTKRLQLQTKTFWSYRCKGSEANRNAIGAKAVLFAGADIRTYEHCPVKRLFVKHANAAAHWFKKHKN